MWCRVLTFCLLATCILFVLLSCIHGRPVTHLLFHRCCGEDIENDHVIFENLENNFLMERLIANGTLIEKLEDTVLDSHSDVEDTEVISDNTKLKEDIEKLRNVLQDFNPEDSHDLLSKYENDNKELQEVHIVEPIQSLDLVNTNEIDELKPILNEKTQLQDSIMIQKLIKSMKKQTNSEYKEFFESKNDSKFLESENVEKLSIEKLMVGENANKTEDNDKLIPQTKDSNTLFLNITRQHEDYTYKHGNYTEVVNDSKYISGVSEYVNMNNVHNSDTLVLIMRNKKIKEILNNSEGIIREVKENSPTSDREVFIVQNPKYRKKAGLL